MNVRDIKAEMKNLLSIPSIHTEHGKQRYKCQIRYDGGVVIEGLIMATSEQDAILKNYAVLVQQGVDEIVVDISCEEYYEDI